MSNNQTSVVRIKDLSGQIHSSLSMSYVADRISLDINRNVTIGLLGESGSGKTQLAMTISGLNTKNYHMEEGCIEYNFDEKAAFTVVPNDQNLSAGQIQFRNLPKKLRKEAIYGNKIGFMFQDPGKSLNPYWTIGRHFNEIARTKKNSNITSYMHRKEKIYSALRLDADLDFRYPDQLSGGQQQRIVIALVLISEPDLIIADEIATGVDVSVKRELMDYLLYIKHHTKSALLIITHDIGFILKVADRIILMYKGTAFQSLDADIVRSVILSFRFANQLHQKSKEYSTQMKQASAQLDVISKELHPYLRELLRSYLFRISLKGDIPDPTKPTGESCPFANRCPDRMDECSQIFPRVTSSSKGWIRCMKFEQNHDN